MHTLRREHARAARIGLVKPVAVGLLALGLLLAQVTWPIAAMRGPGSVAILLAAGLGTVGVGVAAGFSRSDGRSGVLLASAGCLWFVAEWNSPHGSAVAFTVGLAGWVAFPVVATQAALGYPSGRLPSRSIRTALIAAYFIVIGVLGILPALVLDPVRQGCRACPANLLLLDSGSALTAALLRRAGAILAVPVLLLLAAVCVGGLLRSSPVGRRRTGPVLGAAIVLLIATTAMLLRSIRPGDVPLDQVTGRLWAVQGISLLVLSLGVVADWIRQRRSRSRIARYVLAIGRTDSGPDLQAVIAAELRDPTLHLAYPLDDRRLVDAAGAPSGTGGAGRATTALAVDGDTVAVLTHRADLLDDPAFVESVVAASLLPLDNERLAARARAQVVELQESQARIIDSGEAERRRLERDLHDGAQQRLVALMLSLRLARSASGYGADAERLDAAIGELRQAVAAVRRVAAGIYPSVLAESGLRSGLLALAEESPHPVQVVSLPAERLARDAEVAIYQLVLALSARDAVRVAVGAHGRLVTIDVEVDHLPDSLVDVEDRLGALGGTLRVDRSGLGPAVHAELPCG